MRGSIRTSSARGGLIIGTGATTTVAAAFSLFLVTFRANEVVVGLALNIFAGGLTISLTKAIFGTRGSIVGPEIVCLPRLDLPGPRRWGAWSTWCRATHRWSTRPLRRWASLD